jgi:hypothetical protein
MAFETVIELVTANVRERLAAAAVDELAYAAALMTTDTEDVSVRHIAIGLERDRADTLAGLEPEEAPLAETRATWSLDDGLRKHHPRGRLRSGARKGLRPIETDRRRTAIRTRRGEQARSAPSADAV